MLYSVSGSSFNLLRVPDPNPEKSVGFFQKQVLDPNPGKSSGSDPNYLKHVAFFSFHFCLDPDPKNIISGSGSRKTFRIQPDPDS